MTLTTDNPLSNSDALESTGAADRYRAPALDKGLDILELLSEQKEGLTRTEITRELGATRARSTGCSSDSSRAAT
jgi:hypothetical protein